MNLTLHCEACRCSQSIPEAHECREISSTANYKRIHVLWFRFTDIKPSESLESRFKSYEILWSTDEEHPPYQNFVGSANHKQILGLPKVIQKPQNHNCLRLPKGCKFLKFRICHFSTELPSELYAAKCHGQSVT